MKNITFAELRVLLGTALYTESFSLYLTGKVNRMESSRYWDDKAHIRAEADGHYVSLEFNERNQSLVSDCDCADCQRYGVCKHCGAALIKYVILQNTKGKSGKVDEKALALNADELISAYDEDRRARYAETVSIVPVLSFQNGQAFAGFRIGASKTYMILGLLEFSRRMVNHTPYSYGEGFSFGHDFYALDERSRKLCRMIMNYAQGLETILAQKKAGVFKDFGDVRSMPLSGETFDQIFDMYLGEKLPCKEGASKLLCIRDPEPDFAARSDNNGLSIVKSGETAVYDSGRYGYFIGPREICRVSEAYNEGVMPLLNSLMISGGTVRLPRKSAEQFCMSAAPKLLPYLDEKALVPLKPFMPEELQVRYLLDMPEKGLMTCFPNFNYTGRFVECFSSEDAYPDIRRNFLQEKAALKAVEQYFDPPKEGETVFTLTDEDKMYELVKTGGDELSKYGEVFISDRLRKLMSAKPPKPTLRAFTGSGMLNLTLDTDEFPVEELEALMRSVREKRKYYRLEDGSFLSLENGQFSAFTRTADSLNLDIRSLSTQSAQLPLYKALYLDEALRKDKSVSLEKDADYRKLLRDFKGVEDGDFPPPESLEKVLRDYQKTGYTWLRTLDKYGFGGILADDMGLGKTLQVLAFLKAIKDEGVRGTALIACPASVVANWGAEAQKWVPSLNACLLTQSAQERRSLIADAGRFDILVTSYDSLRNDIEFHEKNRYRVCVLDEAQYIKNRETKLKKSVDRLKASTRLALTGTPVENRLSELYSIFDFLMPGYLGSYTGFKRKYETPITEQGDENAKNNLSSLVRPFILRRMKKDVLTELPPKTETNCYIQMGEKQRMLYIAYANEVEKVMLSARPEDRFKLLAMLTRLRQICCDPALVYEGYEEDSCKLEECVRMLEELLENEHRVLVFSQFTSMLGRIEDRLDKQGIPSFTLRGDTPLDERVRLVNAFNAGARNVFLISLKAGGTGINLTGADTVIHYDPWWNLAAQNQATDRCYRIGQERPVQVYKLIASDTIEENIVKLQYRKLDLAKVVNENADGGLMHMSSEELLELLK